jgi:hypothetical protein
MRTTESAYEGRIKQTREANSLVSAEQNESQRSVNRLDRYYVYVDYLTYLDICSSESSVTLIHPVTSFGENNSIGITTNGNDQIFRNPSALMTNGNLGKNPTPSARYMNASAEAGRKNEFGQNERRYLQ